MDTVKNKKVLIFGLGLLGGGVASANWFLKQGAKVTITDLKTKKELKESLAKIKGKVKLSLGGNHAKDIGANEIIVVNPAVSWRNLLVRQAVKEGKVVINDAVIFFERYRKPIIGITGTRGKTTTTQWTAHLIGRKAVIAGNSPKYQFLKMLPKAKSAAVAVAEFSSFALELFSKAARKPDIAVITNVYQDHFNRYKHYEDYVAAKANLFINQTASQHLILNYDNSWTPHLLTMPCESKIWFFSVKPLPLKFNGLFWDGGKLIFQHEQDRINVLDLKGMVQRWGNHNIENLMAAALAAHLYGISWENMQNRLGTLPQIEYRQQIVFEGEALKVVNDTAATSPEGTIAAVTRFGGPSTILITGGTDGKLEFENWGKIIPNYIIPEHIIMLEGSATKKMIAALRPAPPEVTQFKTLEECFKAALAKAEHFHNATILFSPASKSFEKFTNEYDRGEQFNALVKKLLK